MLGTDAQNRDILTRLVWGGRTSLLGSVIPVFFAVIASLVLGLIAGYSRSWLSDLIMRTIDVAFSFPMVLVAIGLATAVGPSLTAVAVSVFLAATPYLTRVVYSEVRTERDKEYIEAAQALGASGTEILFRELLPNVATSAVVYGTTMVGGMIAFAAGLSFLGLGVQPPEADWARMGAEGAKVLILGAPHVATIPAVMIVVIAVAFNWIGDGLRNLLDPRH